MSRFVGVCNILAAMFINVWQNVKFVTKFDAIININFWHYRYFFAKV